ncbi:hypothetical protein TASIC1_0003002700 [Trichoderma asperellum]|uniref:Uncharacterized protein n=1 Tax=Trichoderma asperellum TaxID=101201 RepID=A0A6V8QN75_TRIAP|nr:hypothetical protein TASIC1_0003002700 [Trichoderma asperellum]
MRSRRRLSGLSQADADALIPVLGQHTKGYSSHEQQLADPTNIGAHSNSFTISDQISFLCCRPPIAAALLPASLAAHAAKGNKPLKEEFVGASRGATSGVDEDINLRAAIVCSDAGQPEPEPEPEPSVDNIASRGSWAVRETGP